MPASRDVFYRFNGLTASSTMTISDKRDKIEKKSELETKIDSLKGLYIDWFIERLALDNYYKTGN